MHDDDCNPVPNAVYLIESGRPLEMIKEYIEQRKQVVRSRLGLCKELGVEQATFDLRDGGLSGVVFSPGKEHPDFTKPNRRGISWPRKKTAWHKRLQDQKRHVDQAAWISDALGVPLKIHTVSRATGKFSSGRCIGSMLTECGFLYTAATGIYGLWIPDVAAHVERLKASKYFDPTVEVIEEPAASFSMEIPGCRRIFQEEWDIIVLQAKLKEKAADKAPAKATAALGSA